VGGKIKYECKIEDHYTLPSIFFAEKHSSFHVRKKRALNDNITYVKHAACTVILLKTFRQCHDNVYNILYCIILFEIFFKYNASDKQEKKWVKNT